MVLRTKMAVYINVSFILIQTGLLMVFINKADSSDGCGDVKETTTINKNSTIGSSVELLCNVTFGHLACNACWSVVTGAVTGATVATTVKIIAIGETIFNEHYSLPRSCERNTSTPSTASYFIYNLMINNVTEDQEGLYTCHDQGCNKAKVLLFVEPQQRDTHIKVVILCGFLFAIIIVVIIAKAVLFMRKIPTSQYTVDANESESRFSWLFFRHPPSISRHQFVDTSETKYEKYISQEEMTKNDLSPGGRQLTAKTTRETEYLEILE